MRSRTSALKSSYTDSSSIGRRSLSSTSSRAISPRSRHPGAHGSGSCPARPMAWMRAMNRPIRTSVSRLLQVRGTPPLARDTGRTGSPGGGAGSACARPQRRDHRDLLRRKLEGEGMFLANRGLRPAPGPVEFRDHRRPILDPDLVDPVLVAVQRQQPTVGTQPGGLHGVQDDLRLQTGIGMDAHGHSLRCRRPDCATCPCPGARPRGWIHPERRCAYTTRTSAKAVARPRAFAPLVSSRRRRRKGATAVAHQYVKGKGT
jgi:hypothetical protein